VATQVPDSPGPGRLLLLDGHSLAYRAFFALPIENFSTTTGQPTNAVYGFTAMLIKKKNNHGKQWDTTKTKRRKKTHIKCRGEIKIK